MRHIFPVLSIFLGVLTACTGETRPVEQTIINMEKTALERWGNGDPSGFLDISAPDVVYFDPLITSRLNGHEKLEQLYENVRGKIHIDSFSMPNAKVQAVNDMAVLTFNLNSYNGGKNFPWNCTEVYRKEKDGSWKIIQTHWSVANRP